MGVLSFILLLFIHYKRDSAHRTEAICMSLAHCLIFERLGFPITIRATAKAIPEFPKKYLIKRIQWHVWQLHQCCPVDKCPTRPVDQKI